MVVFKEVAPNLIKLVNTQDDDEFDYALKGVAKHIINEVRDIDNYPTIKNTGIKSEIQLLEGTQLSSKYCRASIKKFKEPHKRAARV